MSVQNYINKIVPAIWAAGPGILIAACLRFDYHQHLQKTASTESTFIVERVQSPSEFLSQGTLLPIKAPSGFSKIYYKTTLISWLAVQVGIMALYTFMDLPPSMTEAGTFELLSIFLEIPVLVVAVLACALLRREGRQMWTYREVWSVKVPKVTDVVQPESDGESVESAIIPFSDFKEDVKV